MGMFESFRDAGSNTYYGSRRTAVTVDVTQVLILYFSFVVAVALLILVIGSRGRERWTTLLRLIFSLHTSVVILLSLFGYGWQTGYAEAFCQYSVTFKGSIDARLGLHLALKNFNVTLTGKVNNSNEVGQIDYNERFSIDKVSSIEVSYMQEIRRGLPWPILHIAEFFYEDRGGLRWMRFYHEAGHFSYIVLWGALVFWAIGNVLIGFVVSRGALFITLSGLSMLCACVIYASVQPPHELVIYLNGSYLTLRYGWCFWLVIVSGMFTTGSGIAILVGMFINPTATSLLFLVDVSSNVEHTSYSEVMLQDKGPLQFKSPYSERRQSKLDIPTAYSNPAFNPHPLGNSLKKRSFSFNEGALSKPNEYNTAMTMKTLAEQSECTDFTVHAGTSGIQSVSSTTITTNLDGTPARTSISNSSHQASQPPYASNASNGLRLDYITEEAGANGGKWPSHKPHKATFMIGQNDGSDTALNNRL